MKKFPLTHTVLYFKGWYKKSDNIFNDLRKTLKMDSYDTSEYTDEKVVLILAQQMDEYHDTIKQCYNKFGFEDFYNETFKAKLFNNQDSSDFNMKFINYAEMILSQLTIQYFVLKRPVYDIIEKPFTCTVSDIVNDISWRITTGSSDDDDLKSMIYSYCHDSMSWVGDFKNENEVVESVLPELKKLSAEIKMKNENELQ